MQEFSLQVRQSNHKIFIAKVTPKTTLKQLGHIVSLILNVPVTCISMYKDVSYLNINSNEITLFDLQINEKSILNLQINLQAANQNMVELIFQYGMERVAVNFYFHDPIHHVKNKISNIFKCPSQQFDLMASDQFLIQENKSILNYGLQNHAVISVKRKIPLSGLGNQLSAKIKFAQSIVSSSQNIQQAQMNENISNFEDSPTHRLQASIQKKSSCSASLRNIKDRDSQQSERQKRTQMKHSSIQPYTMHKNQVDQIQQKQTKRTKIEDIKETMSFGSLEDSKPQQIQVQVQNAQLGRYYKFSCPFGCRVKNLQARLARAQRNQLNNLKILQVDQQSLIEELGIIGEPIRLKFIINI